VHSQSHEWAACSFWLISFFLFDSFFPAHTVIIKGTQIYNAEKGGFEDVGALDIQQIFGRAGRPQFQESGVAMLICEHEKLVRYLGLLTHQLPIESQFIKELPNRQSTHLLRCSVA
jgi:activating signal cointegrator complex subunit 3